MEKCLEDLYTAVKQISPRYFSATGTRDNQTHYIQQIEPSFCAELFHRFRSIMEITFNAHYYENLILHFDVNKESVHEKPDIVLHEDQGNRNNQKMIVEVKADPRVNLTNDFNKIIRDTGSYLNFETVVFIVVNRHYNDLIGKIKQHIEFHSLSIQRRDRIHFISVFENYAIDNKTEYNLFSLNSLYNITSK